MALVGTASSSSGAATRSNLVRRWVERGPRSSLVVVLSAVFTEQIKSNRLITKRFGGVEVFSYEGRFVRNDSHFSFLIHVSLSHLFFQFQACLFRDLDSRKATSRATVLEVAEVLVTAAVAVVTAGPTKASSP